jgi:hypothetical protein
MNGLPQTCREGHLHKEFCLLIHRFSITNSYQGITWRLAQGVNNKNEPEEWQSRPAVQNYQLTRDVFVYSPVLVAVTYLHLVQDRLSLEDLDRPGDEGLRQLTQSAYFACTLCHLYYSSSALFLFYKMLSRSLRFHAVNRVSARGGDSIAPVDLIAGCFWSSCSPATTRFHGLAVSG